MTIDFIILTFPTLFMIHEFEEILLFKWWFKTNAGEIKRRFPNRAEKMLADYTVSTAAFSFIVAEELILITAISLAAYFFKLYALFAGLALAYTIHTVIHLAQFIIWRGYIPAIVTSIITGILSALAVLYIYRSGLASILEITIYGLAQVVILFINLKLFHKIAKSFDRFVTTTRK